MTTTGKSTTPSVAADKPTPHQLIRRTNGKFFTVTFVKKNGDLREMTCRLGVRKHVKGVGMAYEPSEHDLQTVWDAEKKAYRMIHIPSILSFRCGEEVWP